MDSAPPVDVESLLDDEPEELTPPDVARIRGWNRIRAWRWLAELHRVHGQKIVRKRVRGDRSHYVISRQHLALLIKRANERIDPRMVAWVTELEQRVIDVEKRTNVHAEAMVRMNMLPRLSVTRA